MITQTNNALITDWFSFPWGVDFGGFLRPIPKKATAIHPEHVKILIDRCEKSLDIKLPCFSPVFFRETGYAGALLQILGLCSSFVAGAFAVTSDLKVSRRLHILRLTIHAVPYPTGIFKRGYRNITGYENIYQ